jgi:hypothetical protein
MQDACTLLPDLGMIHSPVWFHRASFQNQNHKLKLSRILIHSFENLCWMYNKLFYVGFVGVFRQDPPPHVRSAFP